MEEKKKKHWLFLRLNNLNASQTQSYLNILKNSPILQKSHISQNSHIPQISNTTVWWLIVLYLS